MFVGREPWKQLWGTGRKSNRQVKTLVDSIPSSLGQTAAAVAAALRWPDNLGIQFRHIRLPTQPQQEVVAVFVYGLADEEAIRVTIIEPLTRSTTEQKLSPERLRQLLTAPRLQSTTSLSEAIRGVLEGATALFLDGATEAVLVNTDSPLTRPGGSSTALSPQSELFGPALLGNVALIRKRLRDPAVMAEPRHLPHDRGKAAVIYLEGRADPEVIVSVRDWLRRHAGEEALRRGLATGIRGRLGLVPNWMRTAWPDTAATLLDSGCVVLLLDRMPFAYVTPVTAPALLHGPGDGYLLHPVGGVVRFIRLHLAVMVVLAPAMVIALLNYHQEMMPTPFLLSLAATRENTPQPILSEVLTLELFQDLIRAVTLQLPARVWPGSALVTSIIFLLIAVEAGLVGPIPALVSALGQIASLGLPSHELLYMSRIWRYGLALGAGIFGFYGMAGVWFFLITYLFQATSFGIPFVGPTGLKFTAPEGVSSQRRGGRLRAQSGTVR